MISVGIDLGTTNTLAAAYLDDGRIEFVKDNVGKVLIDLTGPNVHIWPVERTNIDCL